MTFDYYQKNCRLCKSLCNSQGKLGKLRLENTQLFGTKNFVVLPALGPLMPGHVLVISRKHFLSLASMGIEAISEYFDISETLSNKFLTNDFIEIEHGSIETECAGASVIHAHVHWIPGLGNFYTMLEGCLKPLQKVATLTDLVGSNLPYIYLRGGEKPPRFYEAYSLEMQFMRRRICELLGRGDWNWRKYPHPDWVQKTIFLWQKAK